METVLDGGIGNALIQKRFYVSSGSLFATTGPTATVDVDHQRMGTVTRGLPKIEHVPLVRTISHIRSRCW